MKDFMESLLDNIMDYQQAYYGSVCRLLTDGTVDNCIIRFNKRKTSSPNLDSLVRKVFHTKEILQNEEGQVICPIINSKTDEVEACFVLLIPKNGSILDDNALSQVRAIAEMALSQSSLEMEEVSTTIHQKGDFEEDDITYKPFFTDTVGLCAIVEPHTCDFLFLNKTWERILGYSIEELKSYPFMNWLHVDDINDSLAVFQEVYEGKAVKSFINRYRTKWGEYKYFEWDITRNIDNGLIYCIGKDITKQHENHEKLFFQSTILRGVQDSVLVIDLEGKVSFVNDSVIQLTGYPRNYLLGRSLNVILKGLDKSNSFSISAEDVLKNDNTIELQIQNKNDEFIWVEVRTSILSDVYGDSIGFLGIIKDITPRKEYEETLMKRNEALSKANKELDNFVYRVSHDLRAPITSALGLIELSMDASLEQVKEYLELQQRSLMKLDSFIHDILNYSRNNRMELRPVKINIKELLHSTVDQYRFINQYIETTVNINIEVQNELYCDESRLSVILNNIISNAFKFTSRILKPTINIKALVEPSDLILTIEDNGIGIKNEHIEKIFDMFYRATDMNNGSGLGLYIVQEAVKKLGGDITVDSVINEGTTFQIVIPNLWSIFPTGIMVSKEKATN
ncbi:PAS domain-containing sensor histidine kinase [Flammeovirga agarivorans]|uniref:histidine kinase n=1 Tax=Flammeovirga agarivorans TaxID=2726742 RepID=A0A7X8XXK7_9BACT|nr:PAS domain S-box protein [Flammeovirga agarivorans]NLR93258.1 PAS domain S-box protein [Flammeovirga agarivorans]